MRILRKRIRGFFVLQAILMCFAGSRSVTNPYLEDMASPFHHYAYVAAYFVSSAMFLGAWWTTRKPSEFRNPVAVAASVISVAIGAYISWTAHLNGSFSRSGGVAVILGIGGLYIYSQGGSASAKSQPETASSPSIRSIPSSSGRPASPSAMAPARRIPTTTATIEPQVAPVPGYFDPVQRIRNEAREQSTTG